MRSLLNKFNHINTFDEYSNNEVIELIHEEVYNAQDSLLKEANEILGREMEEKPNLQDLFKLGFTSEKSVLEKLNLLAQKSNATKVKDNVLYYSSKYLQRFITHECVERICKKYGLLLTDVSRFIGEVPELNQKEIINFKFDYSDYNNQNTYGPGIDLQIIASRDQLNTKGMRVSGINLVKDDPIVLQRVKGGYLIVTAWGPEANDSEIKNAKYN